MSLRQRGHFAYFFQSCKVAGKLVKNGVKKDNTLSKANERVV